MLSDDLSAWIPFADLNAIGRNAHVITGTAGNIGAMLVSHLARLLNDACEDGNPSDINRFVDELMAANVLTSDAIHNWLDGTAAAGIDGHKTRVADSTSR
jgi:chemotaxis protein histidine kinase CheA